MTQSILITSALPYINGVKHLGNLAGSLLPADVHARYHRLRGTNVLFVCGTDEHGTPAEIAAQSAGEDIATYCRIQHDRQADIYRRLDIAFDHFSRTSGPTNCRLTQQFYETLLKEGLVETRSIPAIWSPADQRYLPDRYVLGRCPHCNASARGDQCEGCGSLLDATDLLDPYSAISGSRDLEHRQVEHLFLCQSLLKEDLRTWLSTRSGWPDQVLNLAKSHVEQELKDRCITRDLAWGIPVPGNTHPNLRFWVWFDAPIGYLSAVAEWADASDDRNAADWTSKSADVSWVQFLAKDNVPFHAVTFPATLLGAGLDYRPVDIIKGYNWLQFNGQKFSTSGNHGIFCDTAIDLLPADAWRWWLTANAPETGDTNFTVERFVEGVNQDLADGIGNLYQRLCGLCRSLGLTSIPDGPVQKERENALEHEIREIWATLIAAHENRESRAAAVATRRLWTTANTFISHVAPWSEVKIDEDAAYRSIATGFALVALVGHALTPITPGLSKRISDRLEIDPVSWKNEIDLPQWIQGVTGKPLTPGPQLFEKIGLDHAIWEHA